MNPITQGTAITPPAYVTGELPVVADLDSARGRLGFMWNGIKVSALHIPGSLMSPLIDSNLLQMVTEGEQFEVSSNSICCIKKQGDRINLNGATFTGCSGHHNRISDEYYFNFSGDELVCIDGNFSHNIEDGEEINIVKIRYRMPSINLEIAPSSKAEAAKIPRHLP